MKIGIVLLSLLVFVPRPAFARVNIHNSEGPNDIVERFQRQARPYDEQVGHLKGPGSGATFFSKPEKLGDLCLVDSVQIYIPYVEVSRKINFSRDSYYYYGGGKCDGPVGDRPKFQAVSLEDALNAISRLRHLESVFEKSGGPPVELKVDCRYELSPCKDQAGRKAVLAEMRPENITGFASLDWDGETVVKYDFAPREGVKKLTWHLRMTYRAEHDKPFPAFEIMQKQRLISVDVYDDEGDLPVI